jgi:hypothetical protein
MTKLEIFTTPLFDKKVKQLKKRFKNIQSDLDNWSDNLTSLSELGVCLGGTIYKARVANSNKNRGKSAGYRLITYLKLEEETLTFIYIYDKSDIENINEQELDKAIVELLENSTQ